MLGAYSNIKNRFFANGGERESPFLEELRDESVVREMEEWNFGQVGTVCGLFMGGLMDHDRWQKMAFTYSRANLAPLIE